jgi:hypothetical protein
MTYLLFLISLCALAGMIAGKMFQMNVRRIQFITNLSTRGDKVMQNMLSRLAARYRLYKKIAYLFTFEFLPSYAYEILVKMKDSLARKYYAMGDQFRGRRILRNSGSVSFFLERLADEKPEVTGKEA